MGADEGGLPEFIEFDKDLRTFKVKTGNPFAEGEYAIKLQATTPWTLLSPVTHLFNVTIACVARRIKHKQKSGIQKLTYYMNSGVPFEFSYQMFDTEPKCMKPPKVKYTAKTLKGSSLPAFLQYDSENHLFTIKENMKLLKETVEVVVSGSLSTGASSQFRWRLKVEDLAENLLGNHQEVKLPEMVVRVQINKEAIVGSAEFLNIKEESEALKNFVLVKQIHQLNFV